MAKRIEKHSATSGNRSGGLIMLVVIVLLVAAVVLACRFNGQQPKQDTAGDIARGTPASVPAEIVSDDRILFGGAPIARRPDITFTTLKNSAYIVGYSETRRDPLWSAYRVIHKDHPFVLERPKGEFLTDDRTEARVTHHDFTGSGFDRGHMTPNSAIARCYGEEAQKETFLLSNICPQAPALNQKVWEKLEMHEITYADEYDEVWVVDGPVFADLNGGVTRTLRSGIAVPAAFYKILLEDHAGAAGGRPRVFSVIMPQMVRGTEHPEQYVTSVAEIESETGLEFFPKLDAGTREELKSRVWPMW
ncbi:MAG TPA: DNA/RNA non-specific endonuclease [Phycisphaerae bacterium]|nr:DNA/RNA non-specific endonuclease [Phycisphaerae bacterium]